MQRKAQQHKDAAQTGLTVAQIDALITAYEARRTQLEYRHEQREELSGAKRDMENHGGLAEKIVRADLHTAKIDAYAQVVATITESISVLVKSLTPARPAAYAAALLTLLHAIVTLFK